MADAVAAVAVGGERVVMKLATVEWGTFLGPEHLAQVDVEQIRSSGAFERVVELSPKLVYLQVTAKRLPKAREALGSLLMDISDVNLD